MAIELDNSEQMSRVGRALRYAYTHAYPSRQRRKSMIELYRGRDTITDLIATSYITDDIYGNGRIVNLYQSYVRGYLLSVAYQSPRWSIRSRTVEGRGFDQRIQSFLTRYSEILDLATVFRSLAVDSAFGRAVCKVINSIAPRGISSPVAPRAFRISPDNFLVDHLAESVERASVFSDYYFVPLNEARQHPHFDPEQRASIPPYMQYNDGSTLDARWNDEGVPDQLCRLIDVYLPSQGVIATYPHPNDSFSYVGTDRPLQVIPSPINPYEICDPMTSPENADEVSKLWNLRHLDSIVNRNWLKAARQNDRSKGVNLFQMGDEADVTSFDNADDRSYAALNNLDALKFFNIPAADPAVLNLANMATQTFSREAGNLEVALGHTAGADTARQTQALIGQIGASQALDREVFERFQSNIGKKLAALAFDSESLELASSENIPGTELSVNAGWGPPEMLPRMGTVDDYHFEVIRYSGGFRPPQERIQQLMTAISLVTQLAGVSAQGLPVNLEAAIKDISESFDLVPNLQEWLSGEKPSPAQKATDTYTSLAQPPQGSNVNYNSSSPQGGAPEPAAGLPAGALE